MCSIFPWCMEYPQNSWTRQYLWHTICCKKYFASDMNGSVSNNRRWNIFLTTNVPIVLLAQMGYFALTGYHTKHWSNFRITVSWFCIIPLLVALYMWHDCTMVMHNKTVHPQERKCNQLFRLMLFQTCMAAVFLIVQANFILFYFIQCVLFV